MKRKMNVLLIVFFIMVTISYGQDKGFGIGALFGEPTGISAKYWINREMAIDGLVSWSFTKTSFQIHSDFLYHFIHLLGWYTYCDIIIII